MEALFTSGAVLSLLKEQANTLMENDAEIVDLLKIEEPQAQYLNSCYC